MIDGIPNAKMASPTIPDVVALSLYLQLFTYHIFYLQLQNILMLIIEIFAYKHSRRTCVKCESDRCATNVAIKVIVMFLLMQSKNNTAVCLYLSLSECDVWHNAHQHYNNNLSHSSIFLSPHNHTGS